MNNNYHSSNAVRTIKKHSRINHYQKHASNLHLFIHLWTRHWQGAYCLHRCWSINCPCKIQLKWPSTLLLTSDTVCANDHHSTLQHCLHSVCIFPYLSLVGGLSLPQTRAALLRISGNCAGAKRTGVDVCVWPSFIPRALYLRLIKIFASWNQLFKCGSEESGYGGRQRWLLRQTVAPSSDPPFIYHTTYSLPSHILLPICYCRFCAMIDYHWEGAPQKSIFTSCSSDTKVIS